MSVSRIARRTPDIAAAADPKGHEPGSIVAEVEQRLQQQSGGKRHSSRARAQELHREADRLYFKGDYESALVLYHRAARLCPREAVHSVAARRAEMSINLEANPTVRLSLQQRRRPRPDGCPEIAAIKARAAVAKSENPDKDVPKILEYLDSHRDFWHLQSPGASPRVQPRFKTMIRQLNKCVRSTLRDVESAHASGDSLAVHQLSGELVNLVSLGEEPHRSQMQVLKYLLNKQMEMGRHDRAADLAAKMIFLARSFRDTLSMVEALVIVGKVHIKFGCFNALAQVWERLADEIRKEAIPSAWLHYDIGRCHLEMGNYSNSLHFSKLCLEQAKSAKSKKWILRGHLLSGQSLLKLGRLVEATENLKTAARMAAEDEAEEKVEASDRSILLYVQGLIDQVTCLLRGLNRNRVGRIEFRSDEMESDPSTDSINKVNRARTNDETEVSVICGSLEEEEVRTPDERIAKLLERTRALRREHCSPRAGSDKNVQVPGLTEATLSAGGHEDTDVVSESSRTRVISRGGWAHIDRDDGRILRPDELRQLSSSGSSPDTDRNEEDVRSEMTAKEEACADEEIPVVYFSPDEEQLTSRSFSPANERDFQQCSSMKTSPVGQTKEALDTGNLSTYLRSLESCEFLKQEQPFLESKCNPSGSL